MSQAFAQHVAIVEPPHEMSFHAAAFEQCEKQFGHAVVDDALVFDCALFLGIEGGRVVLKIGDNQVRVRRRIQFLRLALVEHFELFWSRFHDFLRQRIGVVRLSYLRGYDGQTTSLSRHARAPRDYPHRL